MKTLLALLILSPQLAHADDARKLAETGWTAYQHHDLEQAEKLTRQAIAAATDSNVKAAALYNLGRVLEDRKDKAGAIDAYKQSLALRGNGVVRDRLRTLDAGAADALDALKPTAMQGPFDSFDAWCVRRDPSTAKECATATSIPYTLSKLPSPIASVELRALDQDAAAVVVKLGGKLYIDELHTYEDTNHCTVTSTAMDGTKPHGSLVEVDVRFAGNCDLREDSWTYRERALAVIAVGPGRVPYATPGFVVDMTETMNGKKVMDWARTVTWNKDGSIDVAIARAIGTTQDASVDDTEDVRGHHALAFP
ncbi:MAG TPA: tetratricopeptide repeat protein [Kofleriaceae bacterium]|nr:tetratricopeptide repeat protein [Kofleriaceae bacterium]